MSGKDYSKVRIEEPDPASPLSMPVVVQRDILEFFLGEVVGRGYARVVYAYGLSDDFVVKVEQGWGFQNVEEWKMWKAAQGTEWEPWLAPCFDISRCGCVLVQRKVQPVREDQMPERLPNFLRDLKLTNFGLFEGRVVCHDYGLNNGLAMALRRAKLKRR